MSVFVLARAFRHTLSVQTFALHGAVFFSLLWSAFLWAVLLSLPENMTSTRTANLRLGSFNVGVVQSMLTGENVCKVMEKASDVITLCVQDFGLHMFSMCEFGGHKQGLEDASIDYRNMKVFQAGPEAVVSANYMTAWNFAADASGLAVRHLGLENHNLKSSGTAEPHLVVTTFQVGADAGLIQGNLHIRTPTGAKVSICTRKRVLTEALRILEETPAPTDSDGVPQPVAYVLVGDPNLSKEDAEEAVQALQPNDPQWDTVWHVHETTEQRRGDIVLVKGAHAMALDLPVGPDKANKGIRNDQHDAIGVELRFASEHSRGSRRKMDLCTRKRVIAEAVRILEETPAPTDSDGAPQPVAYVLVGDHNLSKEDAEQAVQAFQPNDPQWDAPTAKF